MKPRGPARSVGYFGEKYLLLQALRQRGKGSVYRGMEILNYNATHRNNSIPTSRAVIIKEDRECGEMEIGGIAAIERLQWQSQLMQELYGKIKVPKVYEEFWLADNFYLVMEDLGGQSLRNKYNWYGVTPAPATAQNLAQPRFHHNS